MQEHNNQTHTHGSGETKYTRGNTYRYGLHVESKCIGGLGKPRIPGDMCERNTIPGETHTHH